jgi:hypothetical protein
LLDSNLQMLVLQRLTILAHCVVFFDCFAPIFMASVRSRSSDSMTLPCMYREPIDRTKPSRGSNWRHASTASLGVA